MTARRRDFGTVRRLPSGRYQARFTTPAGTKRPAPHTFAYKVDAQGWLTRMAHELDTGRFREQTPTRVTFGAYAADWLTERHVSGRPLKARTIEHYTTLLDGYLLPAFGERLLGSITVGDVKAWHANTLAGRPTYRAHCYSLLRSILNSAVNDELIESNPARIRGASTTTRARTIRTATPSELTTLAAAMPRQWALMILIAGWCGLRYGECVELRRIDIDLSNEIIHVRRGAVRTRGGYLVDTTKSAAGVRDVTIPPHILGFVRAHLTEFVAPSADALLFPAETGSHLQPATFNRHWYKARKTIGRDDLRFHDLRHTAGTLAAISGASLAELMQRLGHSSVQASIRYQHVAAGRAAEIAERLSKLADTP